MTTTGSSPETVRPTDELVDAVVRLMPDAAVVVDGAGRIVAANALAERQFGYSPEALIGTAIESLVPDRFRSRHGGHRSSYTSRPTRRPMGAGLSLWALRRDGSEFPVDISLAPLGLPERPLTLAAVRDLTERRAEWEAEARLASIVSSSDDAIVSFDLTGTLMSWNPGAERLFGHTAQDMIGHSYWRLVPAELRPEVEERMARTRAGMRIATYDTRRLHSDGRLLEVAESMSMIPELSGEPGGFSALLRDITERKRSELELRLLLGESRRREQWLAAISEVRLALFAGIEFDRWLDLITWRVSELLDADGAVVVVPAAVDSDTLQVAAIRGEGMVLSLGDSVPMDLSLAGKAYRTGNPVVSENFRTDSPAPPDMLARVPIGSVVLVPMTTSTGPAGVLLVTRFP
ncbi:MAG: PAS domain S-box protein, partial [Acidimicrobiales bacterium]